MDSGLGCIRQYTKAVIPVTLPDLYRRAVHSTAVEGRKMSIPEAFRELCGGWTYMTHPAHAELVLPLPKARDACAYATDRGCPAHSNPPLVVCGYYTSLKPLFGIIGDGGDRDGWGLWEDAKEMHDLLSADGAPTAKRLYGLSESEMLLTADVLDCLSDGRFTGHRGQFMTTEAELDRLMGLMGNKQLTKMVADNIGACRMNDDYMMIFGVGSPDYTKDWSAEINDGSPDPVELRIMMDPTRGWMGCDDWPTSLP
jgi:hypothetical protein